MSSTTRDLEEFLGLVERRRSSLRMDPDRAIPADLVDLVCAAARWAPCHRRTWPWRFGICEGTARARLGEVVADALDAAPVAGERPPGRFRTKYLRAPTVIVVASVHGETEAVTRENRDAVACAVQNLLLAATAAGLASFWSSGVPRADDAIRRLFGWGEPADVVAVVSLGWPLGDVDVPQRPDIELRPPVRATEP